MRVPIVIVFEITKYPPTNQIIIIADILIELPQKDSEMLLKINLRKACSASIILFVAFFSRYSLIFFERPQTVIS